MAVGDEHLAGRAAFLGVGFLPDCTVALLEFGGVAPRPVQIAADGGCLTPHLVNLEHTGFGQVEVVEKVEIFMEQLRSRQVDAVERGIPSANEGGDALIRRIVDGEMGRQILEILIPHIERDQPDVIIVHMDGVEVALPNITGHCLANGTEQLQPHLRIVGINGVGIGPAHLPGIPEVDHLLTIGKDMFIRLEIEGVPLQRDRQGQVELGHLTFVEMGETGRQNFDLQLDALPGCRFDQLRRQILNNGPQAADFAAQAGRGPANFPGRHRYS